MRDSRPESKCFALSSILHLALALGWFAVPAAAEASQSTSADDVALLLKSQAQALLDAVATGEVAVWDRHLDADARITAEDGSVTTKAEMLKQIRPLPAGVSGKIEVIDFAAVVHGDVAVANYVADEDERYHGHALHCQYRITDTWQRQSGDWKLLASQILALRTDPPPVPLAPEKLDDYVGRYELSPGIDYEIRKRSDGALEGQRTGRAAEALLAEAPDVLFVPGQPRYRKLFRRDAAGRVTGFVERREAWDIPWARKP